MRSRTSSFSFALFKKTALRFWPVWAGYLFVWLIALPGILWTRLANLFPTAYDPVEAITRTFVLENALQAGVVIGFFFGLLGAICVFSFLYFPRSAGAMAVLPYRRGGLFLTQCAAGLIPLLCANVIIVLLAAAVEGFHEVLAFGPLLQWLAVVSMQLVFFYGFAVFCAQLTGNLFVLPILYVVLNFTAIVVQVMLTSALRSFVYGFNDFSGVSLLPLSPAAYLFSSTRVLYRNIPDPVEEGMVMIDHTASSVSGWGVLGVYCAVGVLLVVFGLLLFRKRRMESAGDVVAVRILKPVFKYCFAFGGALVMGTALFSLIQEQSSHYYLEDGRLGLLLALALIFGVIFYFAAEMLIKKSFRVFTKKAVLGCVIFAAVLALFSLAAENDLFGFERAVPDASNIVGAEIIADGSSGTYEEQRSFEQITQLHEAIVSHKAENERALREAERTGWFEDLINVQLYYRMQNGRVITREYQIMSPAEDIRQTEELLNLQEAISSRKKTDIPVTAQTIDYADVGYYDPSNSEDGYLYVTLTPEEAYELYTTCIVPDIEEGKLGRVWLITDESYAQTVCACTISISLYTRASEESYTDYISDYFYTTPTVYSERTNAWLQAHGILLVTDEEAYGQVGPEEHPQPASDFGVDRPA